ncbi:MAG: dihydroorotase [Gammaproteobacteria bacterium]
MRIVIRGGRVIDPATQLDASADVYIADGRIAGIDTVPDFTADRVIDAGNMLVIPGLVDLCARLREPGLEHKATIASETRAAAAAGITTLCVPPDTDPVIDTPAVVDMIQRRSRQLGRISVKILGALTRGLDGKRLAEMDALKNAGCIGVSNALQPMANAQALRRAFEYAVSCGLKVYLYAEDAHLRDSGVASEGAVSTRLGLPGIPETVETVALAQALLLAEQTGAHVHFCRLSSARAVAMLADAQSRGLAVTADVAITHLHLTDAALAQYDPNCHLLPPLRSEDDRRALCRGVQTGVISAICSDHQPHDDDAKAGPFVTTQAGASTLEHLLPLTLQLVSENHLDMTTAIAAITARAAEVLGLNVGSLQTGRSADVCIVDPAATWVVSADTLQSAGKNTPFLGQTLQGRVQQTLRRGQFSFDINDSRLA